MSEKPNHLNAENYKDTTAGIAIGHVVPTPKWSSNPVYVAPGGQRVKAKYAGTEAIPISEMDMEGLLPHLAHCAKANGDPFACVDCKGGCAFGTRAVEILNTMTNPMSDAKEKILERARKGAQAQRHKAMLEYKAAIESSDPIAYVLEHSHCNKYQAKSKLKRWERDYGGFIKAMNTSKNEKAIEVSEEESVPVEPHLKQMPCLSKKVAEEEAVAGSMSDIFNAKIKSLNDAMRDIQEKINDLNAERDIYSDKINTLVEAAKCLGLEIEKVEGYI